MPYRVVERVYTDTTRTKVVPGTEIAHGPFETYEEAKEEAIGKIRRRVDECMHWADIEEIKPEVQPFQRDVHGHVILRPGTKLKWVRNGYAALVDPGLLAKMPEIDIEPLSERKAIIDKIRREKIAEEYEELRQSGYSSVTEAADLVEVLCAVFGEVNINEARDRKAKEFGVFSTGLLLKLD